MSEERDIAIVLTEAELAALIELIAEGPGNASGTSCKIGLRLLHKLETILGQQLLLEGEK